MKDFLSWLHHHPIKACGFTCLFTMAACLYANDAVNPWVGGTMFAFGLPLWICIYWRDTEKDWDFDHREWGFDDDKERNM